MGQCNCGNGNVDNKLLKEKKRDDHLLLLLLIVGFTVLYNKCNN